MENNYSVTLTAFIQHFKHLRIGQEIVLPDNNSVLNNSKEAMFNFAKQSDSMNEGGFYQVEIILTGEEILDAVNNVIWGSSGKRFKFKVVDNLTPKELYIEE